MRYHAFSAAPADAAPGASSPPATSASALPTVHSSQLLLELASSRRDNPRHQSHHQSLVRHGQNGQQSDPTRRSTLSLNHDLLPRCEDSGGSQRSAASQPPSPSRAPSPRLGASPVRNYHLSTSAIYAAHVHAALSQSANLAAAASVGPAVAAALTSNPLFSQQFEGPPGFPQRASVDAPQPGSSGQTLQSPPDETASSRVLASSCSQNPGQQDGATTFHHYHHHHHQHHVAFPLGLSQQAFYPALQQAISRLHDPYAVVGQQQPSVVPLQEPAAPFVTPQVLSEAAGAYGTRSLPHTPPARQPYEQTATSAASTAFLTSLGDYGQFPAARGASYLLNNVSTSSYSQHGPARRHPSLVHRNSTPAGGFDHPCFQDRMVASATSLARQPSQRSTHSTGAPAASRSLLLLGDELGLETDGPGPGGGRPDAGEAREKQDPEPGICSDCCEPRFPEFCAFCCPKGRSNTVAVSVMCVIVIFFIVLSPLFHFMVPK